MTETRCFEEDYININPLQTGGKTNSDTRKSIDSYIDGYSVCDFCAGSLHKIKKPDFEKLLNEISQFLGCDETIFTNGCREAKFAVLNSLCEKGDTVLIDENRHYSTDVAAELAGVKKEYVKNNGAPTFHINPEDYRKRIDETKPKLVILTHVDGNYGNIVDAEKVGKICREKNVPFLLNTAYSSGRMVIDNKKIGADFIACSCHKSWGVGGGTLGLLAINKKFDDKVFKTSVDYKKKILQILGCSARGSSTIALLNSFPSVRERVKKWNVEVDNAKWFIDNMISNEGIQLLGDYPHMHDVMHFETPKFDEIANKHKDKGYFLHKFLDKKGITGIIPGRTKSFKMSTYGYSRKQLEYLYESFLEALKL
ncbi:O-phospho-L-seryl-tRNA:Cys-tRNA synthase 1 [Candidatus Tiddalikarchaeum anstoanum]|nr:O-phospho-L-seryl-tRNA:Cys-tRNA synthase 1 [Candidatus Tiddalikarchaeum anstoanum]